MTTYYVDGALGLDTSSGLSGAPVKTIAKGISKATAPDDIVMVAPGSYNGAIYSATIANGTSGHPVTLKSSTQYGAKIQVIGTQGSGSGHDSPMTCALEIQADWWVVDGFEIDGSAGYSGDTWVGSGPEWNIGVYLTGSHSIAQNNKIHDLAKSTTTSATNGGGGIVMEWFYGGSAQQCINNIIYRIGSQSVRNNTVHGIYVASANAKAVGNLVYACSSAGIQTWHSGNAPEYANNTIFNCNQGLIVGAGDAPGGVTNNGARVYNNIVVHCDTTGIDEEGATGSNNLYVNNLVWSCGTNWALLTGSQSGSINADPQFVNYITSGGGDYTLKGTSPALNAGVSGIATSPAVTAPTVDLAGNARPLGTAIDIGAFEYVSSTVTSGTATTRQASKTNVVTGIAYHFASTTAQGQSAFVAASGANTTGSMKQAQSSVVAGFAAVTSFLSVATRQGQSAQGVTASTYKVDTHAATYQGQAVSAAAATQIVTSSTASTKQAQSASAVSIASGTSFVASYQGQSASIAAASTVVSSLAASTQQGQSVIGVTFGSKSADLFGAAYQGQKSIAIGTPVTAAHGISAQGQSVHISASGAAGTYMITKQGQTSHGAIALGATATRHHSRWKVSITK